MKISNIPKEVINNKGLYSREHTILYPYPTAAWWQGWDAAIRFVKRAENAAAICEHCGKIIETYNGIFIDHDGHYFCEKCYRKQEHFGTARAK